MLQAIPLRIAAFGLPPVLVLAAVFFGSDNPASALVFSIPVLVFSALAILSSEIRFERIDLAVAVLFLAFAGYSGFRGWLSTGAPEYATLAAGLALFFAARTIGYDAVRARTTWVFTLMLLAGLSFAAFLDHTISPQRLFWIDHPYSGIRLSSPFLSANTAATLHGTTGLMAIAFMLSSASQTVRRQRTVMERTIVHYALPLAAFLAGSTSLFLSGSRAGILLFLAGAAVLLLAKVVMPGGQARERPWVVVGGVSVVLTSLLVIFSVSGGIFSDRLPDVVSGRESVRSVIFLAYLKAIGLAPMAGNGLGGFEYINALIAEADNAVHIMRQGAAHNLLQWGLQAGWLGLATLIGVWLWLFRRLADGVVQRRRRRNEILAALIISLFVLLHGMVDYALEIPGFMWIFMWIMGLAVGMSRRRGARVWVRGRAAELVRIGYGVCLAVALILTYVAMLDRVTAQSLARMNDATFTATFTPGDLTGSARRLAAIGDRAMVLTIPDIGLALAAYRAAIEVEPRDGLLHAKFSYAALIGGATNSSVDALGQSYLRMPYAPRAFRYWRLELAGSVYAQADDALRAAILRETRLLTDSQQEAWTQRYQINPVRL